MLSPHEIAALMLIENAQHHHELNPADLNALLDRRLVWLEPQSQVHDRRLHLTNHGRHVLDAIAGKH